MASINIQQSDMNIMETTKNVFPKLCRNDVVFIEHYIAKFRRDLIVGMSAKVFKAIQCHFDGKVMTVRQELLSRSTLSLRFASCCYI